jgi:hypothetical protein
MRIVLVLAAVLLLPALAGCLGSSSLSPQGLLPIGAPGSLGPTASVAHGFDGLPLDPVRALGAATAAGGQYHIGVRSFEPTLGIAPDGTLYMTGYAPNPMRGSSPTVIMSQDQGMTWTDVGPKLPTGHGNPPNSNDPYVYVDPATGRVFMSDLQALLCSTLEWSDDKGATWSQNPVACGTPGGNDHQTIVASKPVSAATSGYPNVLTYCVNRVADTACAQSLDGGMTFQPLMSVYPGVQDGNLCGGLMGHVKAGPDGKLYLPKTQCGVPEVAISGDDGATWERHVLSEDVGSQEHEVAVAIDEENHVYAFWIDSDGFPVFAASADGGSTWSPARKASPPGVTATEFPAIAAGADGRVAFAYIGTTLKDGYGNDMSPQCSDPVGLQCTDPTGWEEATWNAYIGVMTNALDPAPTIVTVTVNDPLDPVARGICGRTRCGSMGDFIDIVIDPAGRPWAAFVDMCNETCVSDASSGNDAGMGFMGTLVAGPALRGVAAALPQLLPQPAMHEHAGAAEDETLPVELPEAEEAVEDLLPH